MVCSLAFAPRLPRDSRLSHNRHTQAGRACHARTPAACLPTRVLVLRRLARLARMRCAGRTSLRCRGGTFPARGAPAEALQQRCRRRTLREEGAGRPERRGRVCQGAPSDAGPQGRKSVPACRESMTLAHAVPVVFCGRWRRAASDEARGAVETSGFRVRAAPPVPCLGRAEREKTSSTCACASTQAPASSSVHIVAPAGRGCLPVLPPPGILLREREELSVGASAVGGSAVLRGRAGPPASPRSGASDPVPGSSRARREVRERVSVRCAPHSGSTSRGQRCPAVESSQNSHRGVHLPTGDLRNQFGVAPWPYFRRHQTNLCVDVEARIRRYVSIALSFLSCTRPHLLALFHSPSSTPYLPFPIPLSFSAWIRVSL